MMEGLIGKKVGMTQVYTEDGRVIPATVIKAGPCVVVGKVSSSKDGVNKFQLGYVEDKKVKNVNKPLKGHFDKAGVPPTKVLKEFYSSNDVKVGDNVKADIFSVNEKIKVTGITKGKGFQGVVRRWNFGGGRATHGSMFHRAPGSIGMCAYPGEVHKGKKMPGRMGGKKKSVKGLNIVKIDLENNLILVKGAVPGYNGNYLYLTKQSF